MMIRRKELSRNEALKKVKDVEGKFPETFLGRKLEEILYEIDMSLNEFIQVCDRFTNKKIFQTDENRNLIKDNKLRLKKINYDN